MAWVLLAAAGMAHARELPLLFETRKGALVARGDRQSWHFSESGRLTTALEGSLLSVRLAGSLPGITARPSGRFKLPLFDRTVRRGPRGVSDAVFRSAVYRGVYDGVDLVYSGTRRRLEYRFSIAPYGCASCLRLAFEGAAQRLSVDPDGSLRLAGAAGELRYSVLRVSQPGSTGLPTIRAHYELRGAGEIAVTVDTYDPTLSLAIEASISYSTYLGGTQSDSAYAMAVDAAGCAYIAGETASPDFPLAGPFQNALAGDRDIFVTKLNASGNQILYSTYLGGSSRDTPRGIAVDAAGNAYITGFTYSPDFPTTNGALRRTAHAEVEGFVLKLNPDGSALVYSTYVGGTRANYPAAIAVNAAGEATLAGYTDSFDLPVTAAAPQRSFAGPFYDAFVMRLNAAATALLYSTYLGGARNDLATALALDGNGNIYVAGCTDSPDFPTRSPLSAYGGNLDAFLAKLDGAGQLVFSTYLGGTGADQAAAIAVDASGGVYVAGATQSVNFPVTPGAYAASNHGGYDAFLAHLNPAGTSLLYSTLLGGSGDDQVRALALHATGSVLLAGTTTSADFPVVWDSPSSYAGRQDGFVAVMVSENGTAALKGSRYFGGPEEDVIAAVAAGTAGDVYAAGWTITGMAPSAASFQDSAPGAMDAFVLRLTSPALVLCTAAATPLTAPAWALVFPASDLTLSCSGGTAGTLVNFDLRMTFSSALSDTARPVLQSGAAVPVTAELSGDGALIFRSLSFIAPGSGSPVVLRIAGIVIRGPLPAGTQVSSTITATEPVALAAARQTVISVQSSPVSLSNLRFSRTATQAGCLPPAATTDFTGQDASVVFWFAITGGVVGDIAHTEWVAPTGQSYRTYMWAPLAAAGSACFWDVLPVASTLAASLTGTWTANLYWDGFVLASASFTLRSAAGRQLVWLNDVTRQVVVHYFSGPRATTDTGWAFLNSSGAPGWTCVSAADFDRNGVPDLVWLNDVTRQVVVHFFGGPRGTTDIGWAFLNSSGAPGWRCVGAADFDRNGVPDLIWLNDATRQVVVHFFGGPQGTTKIGWAFLNSSGAPGWTCVGAADFDRNGVPDLIWLNDVTRQVVVHFFGGPQGTIDIGWAFLNSSGAPGWTCAGAVDFDGNGVPDLVWLNDATRQVVVHFFGGPRGTTDIGWDWLNSAGAPGWHIAAPL